MSHLIDALLVLPPWLVLVVVFALPAAEAGLLMGVFVPGETAVLLGGVIAHSGALPLWAVMLAASLGAAVGDQIGYILGRRYGTRLIERPSVRRHRSQGLDPALDFIRRRGAAAVALGRWAALLRAVVPAAAGVSGMTQARFTISNVLGGTMWAMAMATAGYLAGASYRRLASDLGIGGDILLGALAVAGAAWLIRVRHTRRKATRLRPERRPGPDGSTSQRPSTAGDQK